jgi:HD-GYP domain-containing protein (c-di-GMP phosphodiesterase class II)
MAAGIASVLGRAKTGFRPAHQGLAERLACLHDETRRDYGSLHRIAIAIYDARTDLLKSFVHSSEGESPFEHAVARLATIKPLLRLSRTGETRVIDDFSVHHSTMPAHNKRLMQAGYLSSCTVPMFHKWGFYGFVFFNSCDRGYFTPQVVRGLKPIAEVVALNAVMELDAIRMIQAAVKTVRHVSHARDEETGGHLERMARYARIIALRLAPRLGMSDDFVEFLFQFAPLHDIGKIGVSDDILFKPGRLDAAEFEIMKGHVAKGIEIVDVMAETFRVGGAAYVRVLRNVVAHHHECVDGSGYPFGLAGDNISVEGRICKVADVFDALTSRRPHRAAWCNEEAMLYLMENAGSLFDPDCVGILRNSAAAVADIQRQFAETDVE